MIDGYWFLEIGIMVFKIGSKSFGGIVLIGNDLKRIGLFEICGLNIIIRMKIVILIVEIWFNFVFYYILKIYWVIFG